MAGLASRHATSCLSGLSAVIEDIAPALLGVLSSAALVAALPRPKQLPYLPSRLANLHRFLTNSAVLAAAGAALEQWQRDVQHSPVVTASQLHSLALLLES